MRKLTVACTLALGSPPRRSNAFKNDVDGESTAYMIAVNPFCEIFI